MSDRSPASLSRRRLMGLCGLAALGSLSGVRQAFAGSGEMVMHDHDHGHEHHHHDHAAMSRQIKRSEAVYRIPELTLVRQDGAQVAFPAALDNGQPVLLDFIYTSCTAICPLTSRVFYEFQEKLGKERDKVRLVSISIDPEYDTPARLSAYAKKFNAGDEWQHYTGTAGNSIAMQKAFDVYRGDKMNHMPVTFLRAAPGQPWVRLDGFASPDDLVQEYRRLIKGA